MSTLKLPVAPIDFHTHIGEVRSFNPKLKGWVRAGVEDLLSYMSDVGVERAVVLSLPTRADPYASFLSNRRLLKVALQSEGVLIPFCCPSPFRGNAAAEVRRMVSEGCAGLGELKVRLRIDDPRIVRLLKAAESAGVPALVHIEEGPYFHYCYGIDALAVVMRAAPDLKLIVHGPGWWNRISREGGRDLYPSGPVEGEGLVHQLLRRFSNLYADLSAASGLNALGRDLEHAARFVEEFQEELLFGTDFPCLSESGQFGPDRSHVSLLLALGLPHRTLRKILRDNALRLLEKGV